MASKVQITIRSNKTQAQLESEVLQSTHDKYPQMKQLENLFASLSGGASQAVVEIPDNATSATGTLTVAASGASSVTIAGGVLTGGTAYAITGTTTAVAAALAAAINASVLGTVQLVSASSSAAVVTLTAKSVGIIGNLITTTATGNVTANQAALAGGTSGTNRVYEMNLASALVV